MKKFSDEWAAEVKKIGDEWAAAVKKIGDEWAAAARAADARAAEAHWRPLERPPKERRRDALATGMTAREAVAARVMAGFAADTSLNNVSRMDLARYAVIWADALFDALEEVVS